MVFKCVEIMFVGQYSVFAAFLDPGDEVIMFEPFFDQYLPSVVFHGGKPVYVPLHPPSEDKAKPTADDWTIDFEGKRIKGSATHVFVVKEDGVNEIMYV